MEDNDRRERARENVPKVFHCIHVTVEAVRSTPLLFEEPVELGKRFQNVDSDSKEHQCVKASIAHHDNFFNRIKTLEVLHLKYAPELHNAKRRKHGFKQRHTCHGSKRQNRKEIYDPDELRSRMRARNPFLQVKALLTRYVLFHVLSHYKIPSGFFYNHILIKEMRKAEKTPAFS
jgi:hypothetical protein